MPEANNNIMRFETRVSNDGIIRLPLGSSFINEDVEITVKKVENSEKKSNSSKLFVDKWAGFLKNQDSTDDKYDYLVEKYK